LKLICPCSYGSFFYRGLFFKLWDFDEAPCFYLFCWNAPSFPDRDGVGSLKKKKKQAPLIPAGLIESPTGKRRHARSGSAQTTILLVTKNIVELLIILFLYVDITRAPCQSGDYIPGRPVSLSIIMPLIKTIKTFLCYGAE
jgi:hypothetical protein